MIELITRKIIKHFTGTNGKEFEVLAVYNPNEEQDPWVRYRDEDNNEYTCRQEAFLARFTPISNKD